MSDLRRIDTFHRGIHDEAALAEIERLGVGLGLEESGPADAVQLLTVHKAKGLEADRVFVVDRHLLPAVYAQKAWERQQESNLDYVARTRARKSLIYVNDWTGDPRRMDMLATSLRTVLHN